MGLPVLETVGSIQATLPAQSDTLICPKGARCETFHNFNNSVFGDARVEGGKGWCPYRLFFATQLKSYAHQIWIIFYRGFTKNKLKLSLFFFKANFSQ